MPVFDASRYRVRVGLTVVAQGREIRLAVFGHGPDEPAVVREWWPRTCLVFTEYGAWTVRAAHGGGDVSPGKLLVGTGGAEYQCGHPYGVDDRNICVTFPPDVTAPQLALVPVAGPIARLRQQLRRYLTAACSNEQDADELDSIAWSLMAAVGSPDAPATTGARELNRVRQLRAVLDSQYADATLDTVAAGTDLGYSRTRMIHVFREVIGTTPHRYLVERRVAHAARLLATTDMPITAICFDSGFGSVARFQAAFRRAWGITPSQYRAGNRPARHR
jgi:AraC-like DNA-binding protein